MLKMTDICQVRDKPKMVQLFIPVLKKPFWLKTILRYFMLEWRSRKNFITSRLCSELIVISLHRACACSLQAYGPKSLSLQAQKNSGVWTTLSRHPVAKPCSHKRIESNRCLLELILIAQWWQLHLQLVHWAQDLDGCSKSDLPFYPFSITISIWWKNLEQWLEYDDVETDQNTIQITIIQSRHARATKDNQLDYTSLRQSLQYS